MCKDVRLNYPSSTMPETSLHLLPSGKLDCANIYFGFIAPLPSLRFRLFGEGETCSCDKTGVILYISSLEVLALIRFCLNSKRTPSSTAFGVLPLAYCMTRGYVV